MGCKFFYSSSNMNNVSIFVCSAFAMSWASFRLGLYLPFSRKTMVSLRTPTFLAKSSWVKSKRALNSLILVFTPITPLLIRWGVFVVHSTLPRIFIIPKIMKYVRADSRSTAVDPCLGIMPGMSSITQPTASAM